jgi:predicted RNA binding protein YcfA (HicA-like mRNA interferase family)
LSKLRLCSGTEAQKKFERAGWKIARRKGSQVMMFKSDYPYTLSIPLHKELGIGILKKLIKQAKLTEEEFSRL